MRKILLLLGLVIGGLVAGAVLGEAGIRLLFPRSEGPFIPDLTAFYTLKHGWTGSSMMSGKLFKASINTDGLRGEEYSDDGSPVILCLGDSFTYGLGVEDGQTFPAILDKWMKGEKRVLNAGVPAYNLSQEYSRLKKLGPKFKPETTVLGVFINDWEDLGYTTYMADDRGNLVIAPRSMRAADFMTGNIRESWTDVAGGRRGKFTGWLITHSRLAELIYMKIFYSTMERQKDENANGVAPGSWQRLGTLTRYLLTGSSNEDVDRIWTNGCRIISGMNDMTKSWGGRLVVMYIPFSEQLDRPELDALHDRLKAYLEEQGILFLDLLPVFRKEAGKGLYLPGDGHLSKKGNLKVAEELWQFGL